MGVDIVCSLRWLRCRVPILLPSRVLQLSGGELLQGRRLMVLGWRLLSRILIGLMLRRRYLGKLLLVVVVCLLLLPSGLLKLGLVMLLLLLKAWDGRSDHGLLLLLLLLLHLKDILRLGMRRREMLPTGRMRHLRLAVCRRILLEPALLLVYVKGWWH